MFKYLKLVPWMWLLLGVSSVGSANQCNRVFVSTSRMALIKERYNRLIDQYGEDILWNAPPSVNARRLVNSKHWGKALVTMPDTPWLFYGKETYLKWDQGLRWIYSRPSSVEISLPLLQEIHREVSKGFYYRGYEKNRIDQAFRVGRITKTERDSLFQRIYGGEEIYFSQEDHSELNGRLRTDPLDVYIYSGEIVLPDKRRVANLWTINRLRRNPYFKIDEQSLVQIAPDLYEFAAHFVLPQDVEAKTRQVISELKKSLNLGGEPEHIVRAVIKMQWGLSAIHPFLDGNGRAIRFFSDFILRKYGLPPILYPNENDWVMTQDELFQFAIKGMSDYLKIVEDHFYSKAGPEIPPK